MFACRRTWRCVVLAGSLTLTLVSAGIAGENDDQGQAMQPDEPKYPTTAFEEGAKSASVTAGDVTAGISMVRRPEIDANHEVPVLEVMVGGVRVLETPGVASGTDDPETEASIAKIDPASRHPEVYFASYSGGAHCCTHVVVAQEVGDKWVAVPIGDFDGDGRFIDDLAKDGLAEIVAVDSRFLYQFDCYACSSAPLIIYTVHAGKAVDVTTDKRFLPIHHLYLQRLEEDADPDQRWSSAGFLAGWVAEKVRVGEGADAFKQLAQHWNYDTDVGEEVCTTGGDIDACDKKDRKIMKFPDRLKLFLQQSGYQF